jgi:hypothetical protein
MFAICPSSVFVYVIIPKMDPSEIGWCGVDWIDVAYDRDQGNEPSGSIKCVEILE